MYSLLCIGSFIIGLVILSVLFKIVKSVAAIGCTGIILLVVAISAYFYFIH